MRWLDAHRSNDFLQSLTFHFFPITKYHAPLEPAILSLGQASFDRSDRTIYQISYDVDVRVDTGCDRVGVWIAIGFRGAPRSEAARIGQQARFAGCQIP